MKRMFTTLSVGIILFTSCTKHDVQPEPTAKFTAAVNGQSFTFTEQAVATSEKNSGGNYELTIIGERKITADSSTQIRFVIPDFTTTASTQTITLNANNARSGFIEFIKSTSSLHGAFNFIQSGQLTVNVTDNDHLSGTFSFTYFTFDKYGSKTGEVKVTDGTFTDLKIVRI